MVLSYVELVELIEEGVIDAPVENINGASIDVRLGDIILREDTSEMQIITLGTGNLCTYERKPRIPGDHYLDPGEFVLASTMETFNLPLDICAEFSLKSSIGRCGIQHMKSGWCDPGWNNSVLTLELKNVTQSHVVCLTSGMKIGQMIFHRVAPVPEDKSYKVRGQYNGDRTVTGSKGVK